MTSYRHLPEHLWPSGWSYPPELAWLLDRNVTLLTPWAILHGESLELAFTEMRSDYPHLNVVPVADRFDCDDTACWEVSSGQIIIVHLGADPGHEIRGTFNDFWSFFEQVMTDFIDFARSRTA